MGKSYIVYVISRELNEAGILSILLYAIIAVGIPMLVGLIFGAYPLCKEEENKKHKKSTDCNFDTAKDISITIAGITSVLFLVSVFISEGFAMLVALASFAAVLIFSRYLGMSWGRSWGAVGVYFVASLIAGSIADSICF